MKFPYSLPIIIDGMTSCSEITRDDPDNVCAEKIILDDPDILISAKRTAVENGVNSLLSPTGDILHSRLKDLGYDDRFNEFITEITRICSKTGGEDILTGGIITHKQVGRIEYQSPAFEDCYFSYLEKMSLLKDSGAKYVLLKNHKNASLIPFRSLTNDCPYFRCEPNKASGNYHHSSSRPCSTA